MNSFGKVFRVSIFGESHGNSVGAIIDGTPPGITLSEKDFLKDLSRRKAGRAGTTPRIESDKPIVSSGIFKGKTTGSPVSISFRNKNIQSSAYRRVKDIPRPGHADFTAMIKYKGFNDFRGGGHFSGRLTLGLVAAGTIAKKIISPITVTAKLIEAGGSKNVEKAVKKAIIEKDSIGGLIECKAKNIPAGLGEPFFDSVESLISHAAFSIPAIKGIEFGSGFDSAGMTGSEHNDLIINKKGKTSTNNSGGISGGITNGNELIFRVAVKPTASISKPQNSYSFNRKKQVKFTIPGRHDSCIALRVPPVIEAITAIVLADLKLQA